MSSVSTEGGEGSSVWQRMCSFPVSGSIVSINVGLYDDTHFCRLDWPNNLQIYDSQRDKWNKFDLNHALNKCLQLDSVKPCFKLFTNYKDKRSIIFATHHYIAEYNINTQKIIIIKDLEFVGNYFVYYVDSTHIHLIDNVGHYIVSKNGSTTCKVQCIHEWTEITFFVSSRIIYLPNKKQIFIFVDMVIMQFLKLI